MSEEFELQDFLPYLLNRAAETASLAFQKHYKDRYNMLRTEWRVLAHLGRYGEMTATEIGSRAGVHKTKISRAVAALERKRFLTRDVVDKDRRHAKLALTKSGQVAFVDLCQKATDFDKRMMAQFDPADAELLKRALRQLANLDGR